MSGKNIFGAVLLLAGALIIIGLIIYWAWAELGIYGFLIAIAIICLAVGHVFIGD